MSRIFALLISLVLFIKCSFAQTTYNWAGGANGDYQLSTNWTPIRTTPATTDILAFDATTAITVANVPNQTIGAIKILSGTDIVIFTTNVGTNVLSLSAAIPLIYTAAGSILAGDLLTISLSNASVFTITSGTFGIAPSTGGKIIVNGTLTLAGGKLDFDIAGTGGTVINGSIKYTSGTFICATASAITWTNGSNYYHEASGVSTSAIPAGLWNAGATCNITGMNGGSVAPTGFSNITFANLTWNCSAQIGNVDLDFSGNPLTIAGVLAISNTGTGAVRFSGASNTTVSAGSYVQTNGKLVLQAGTGNSTLQINGNFSHTAGGTIDFVGSGASGTATLSVKGNLAKGAGTTWSSTSNSTTAKMTIQFFGSAVQLVSIDGTWNVPAGGTCNISNTNTDPSGVSTSGTLGLKVAYVSGAASGTCSNGGNFTGTRNIAYSGSQTTLMYNGSVLQTASAVEFPTASAPANLSINCNVGVSFPGSFASRTIPGVLTMTKGALDIGAGNTLFLTNATLSSQLAYTAGFITNGTLSRRFPTNGLPINASTNSSLYPFGTGINNRSVNIYFSSSNITTGGDIAISHTTAINATAVSPTYADNGVTIDKITNSYWKTSATGLNLGGTTISLTAEGDNIGSVDVPANLRLVNGTAAGFGTLIPTTGINEAPIVGKSNLTLTDIDGQTFYIGSDNTNLLQIVTFIWTGLSNTAWTNAGNWTGALGYPSASTEIAIINSGPGNMPVISTGSISLYQLSVGTGASLTMTGTANLSVYDAVTFTGIASFAGTSTFTYASSVNDQNILNLAYGNLAISGTAAKIFPPTTTITGDFTVSGAGPTFGTGTFVYDAGTAAIQRVAATSYYNLTFQGNRGGKTIRLGNGVSGNTIKVFGDFIMNATNYVANYDAFNTFDFSSASSQPIPGFTYGSITNTGDGPRIFDNQGSADPTHVINCKSLNPSLTGGNITTGSKIRLNRNGSSSSKLFGFQYYDWEITGDLGGTDIYVVSGQKVSIAGTFSITATNFKQPASTQTFVFNGTGSQTIPAFKTNTATNTPAWRFSNVTVSNGATPRVVTLGVGSGADTIYIAGTFTPGTTNTYNVTGSTVNFINGSGSLPTLTPAVSGGNNYNNIVISGGTRFLASNLLLGGNLSLIDSDTSATTLNIGDFSNNRTLTILGNLSLNGVSSAATSPNTIIDFNAGSKTVLIKLAGNLSLAGKSQVTTTNGSTSKGTLLFNGTNQQYNNTASFKNGFVNFVVGDATNAISLTLNNNIELIRSGVSPFSAFLTVTNNANLNANTKNITIGTDDNNTGNNATFNLDAGATLITANTGVLPDKAIEGNATDGTNGTILAGTLITKNYNVAANYVLNGATVNPFPTGITTMNNLTIGANVSLNKIIDVNGTLDLASYVLTQEKNDLEFSGLVSTSGSIYADKMSTLTINGTIGTVGTLRFTPGGNSTGQFTINRPVTVPLGSDLIIDNSPLSGNFITGTSTSILDINGNTLTINGAVSGTGFLAGSNTSNLTVGGAPAGTINFASGKRVLKNLSLVNNATATLGTPLDITDGTGPGTEGSVSVTASAKLITEGNLTLKSTANGTARVAMGSGSGGYIIGDVTVERYLSSIRAWRLMAAPTVGQTIKESWQENQGPFTAFGTNITSNSATWSVDGFDFQTPGNSLTTFNPVTNAWDGVPTTNAPVSAASANKAYYLFTRGNRSVAPSIYNPPTEVFLRTKGVLFQGDLPAVLVNAGQYAAIGNNYASAVDFATFDVPGADIDHTFYLWDPKIPGSYGLGAWVTFSAATGWLPSIPGGSYTNISNTNIESGQAFMVHNSNATPGSVTFKESSKVGGSKLVSRPLGNGNKQMLITNLYNTTGGDAKIADGNIVVFSQDYSNSIDSWDALKLNNLGDNLGLIREDKTLVLDARQPVAETDTIFFNMKRVRQQSYRMEFIASNFDYSLMGFLEDAYLHSTTAVNMAGTTNYDFIVNSDTGSSAVNRFRIVFKNSAPLPVTFSVVSATEKNNGINVDWKVENEINIASYDAEKSVDGRSFTKMYRTAAKGQGTGGTSVYNWLDVKPITGDNFYRIRSISKDGKTEYSKIVKVAITKVKSGFTVFPNPVADGVIGLQMNNIPTGIYTVRVINSNGQVLSKEVINHMGGNATKTIGAASMMVSGSYQLEITGTDNKTNILRIVVL